MFHRTQVEHRFGERALIKGVRGTAGSGKRRFGENPPHQINNCCTGINFIFKMWHYLCHYWHVFLSGLYYKRVMNLNYKSISTIYNYSTGVDAIKLF